MSEPETRRFVVSGRVQGVWFRDTARHAAEEIGVVGWVRNRDDGSVECMATGTPGQLDRLRAALEQGSLASRVDEVREERRSAVEEFERFEIRP